MVPQYRALTNIDNKVKGKKNKFYAIEKEAQNARSLLRDAILTYMDTATTSLEKTRDEYRDEAQKKINSINDDVKQIQNTILKHLETLEKTL